MKVSAIQKRERIARIRKTVSATIPTDRMDDIDILLYRIDMLEAASKAEPFV